jgi:hypothetical protein
MRLEKELLRLASEAANADDKGTLFEAASDISWDDAVHIAAPWEPRSSLCGSWFRNLVTLADVRPDGVSGCWTCLMAADWMDKQAEHLRTAQDQREEDVI